MHGRVEYVHDDDAHGVFSVLVRVFHHGARVADSGVVSSDLLWRSDVTEFQMAL